MDNVARSQYCCEFISARFLLEYYSYLMVFLCTFRVITLCVHRVIFLTMDKSHKNKMAVMMIGMPHISTTAWNLSKWSAKKIKHTFLPLQYWGYTATIFPSSTRKDLTDTGPLTQSIIFMSVVHQRFCSDRKSLAGISFLMDVEMSLRKQPTTFSWQNELDFSFRQSLCPCRCN